MYNSRVSIGSTPRKSHTFKTSLGNNTTRLDEKVLQSRKTFYVNST